ncbi:MAG: hypothetical protein GYB65_09200 [Chloroflexi bacterium]|nr:hypothetical protein [Chloroflexota bacterium]
MTKEKLLTRRWNNLLTLGLGLPALVYIIVGLSSSALLSQGGFIGLMLVGAVY